MGCHARGKCETRTEASRDSSFRRWLHSRMTQGASLCVKRCFILRFLRVGRNDMKNSCPFWDFSVPLTLQSKWHKKSEWQTVEMTRKFVKMTHEGIIYIFIIISLSFLHKIIYKFKKICYHLAITHLWRCFWCCTNLKFLSKFVFQTQVTRKEG